VLGSFSAWAGIVTNGGFETGDFSGWTRSGNLSYTYIWGVSPHSGEWHAAFGPVGSYGYISQTLATVPGTYYDFSFWEAHDQGFPAEVWWDGNLVYNLAAAPGDWTQITVNGLLATTSSTVLMLGFRNDPSYTWVDDIDVVPSGAQIPEPSTFLLGGLGLAALAASKLLARKA